MKILKLTTLLLFLCTIAFSQSESKVMLSDKVKEVMLEDLKFNYDSALYLYNPEKGIFRNYENDSTSKSELVLMLENMAPVCGVILNRDLSKLPLIILDGVLLSAELIELEEKPYSKYEIHIVKDLGSTTFCNPRVYNGIILIVSKKT